jgi:S-adenosyl methyltransferase
MATGPTPAGIYDYMLGGMHHAQADREAGEQAEATAPGTRSAIRENRAFVQRAVRYLAGLGIRQFVDLGSGYPTRGSVHETLAGIADEPRVLYVDYDPAVVRLTGELVTKPGVAAAAYDLRRPAEIIGSPEAGKVIDWSQPVAVLMAAVLHFVSDAEDPAGIIEAFRGRMAPGSYLVLSHGSFGGDPAAVERGARAWDDAPSSMHVRTHEQVAALFDGFDLVPPGLVTVQEWGTGRPAPQGQGVVLAGVAQLT